MKAIVQGNLLEKRRLFYTGGIILALFVLLGGITYIAHAVQRFSQTTSEHEPSQSFPAPIRCTAPPHSAGESYSTITSAGLRRTFLIHLPPSYGMYQRPLVIGYHGYSWTIQMMKQLTQLDKEADKGGFILALPQGVDSPPSWNAGVGAYGPTGDADDIQFTRDLLNYLETNYCVNPHRVYLTGFSLGGGMVYRLACTLSNQITAIATVSGAYYPFGGCKPARPLPVLEIHGAADTQAPYTGNPAMHMAAVDDYLDGWLIRDKCSRSPHTFYQQGDVTGIEWTNCATGTEVVHYRVSDGGHAWVNTRTLNTEETVWQFFNKFSR